MPFFHLTARTHWPLRPLDKRAHCLDLWHRLRERFPRCLACVLMPNHFHLLIEAARPGPLQLNLAIELRSFSRSLGQSVREKVPAPKEIPDTLHLKRQIRYVHLNPCRWGLVTDPLEWEWSTHREALGAIEEPWVDFARLKELWGKRDFRREFHRYVSSDPSTRIEGTPFLIEPSRTLTASLEQMTLAAQLAARAPLDSHRTRDPVRGVIVKLADRLGAHKRHELARQLAVTPRAVRKIAGTALAPGRLEAALQTLADPRLLNVRGVEVPKGGTSEPLTPYPAPDRRRTK